MANSVDPDQAAPSDLLTADTRPSSGARSQAFCLKSIWAAPWQNKQNDMCPQLRLRSESSLSAWRKLGSLATHWVHSEDSDQIWQMPRHTESLLGTQSFCWFCHEAAHILCILTRLHRCAGLSERPLFAYVISRLAYFCLKPEWGKRFKTFNTWV